MRNAGVLQVTFYDVAVIWSYVFFHVKNRGRGRCIDVTDCFCRTVGGSLMPYLVYTPLWSSTVQVRCMGSGTVLCYKASKIVFRCGQKMTKLTVP